MLKIREEDFATYDVPGHTQGSIMRYVNDGLHPGGFLTAVIVGDLYGAVSRADEWNQQSLVGIAKFMLNVMPAASIGSAENMERWIQLVREEKARSKE